jgi:dolichyl-phosphate-mannose-protein mannosyltransferase
VNTQGGYLHSHAGSNQQQVTLYPHRDSNNHWTVLNVTSGGPANAPDWEHKLAHVTNGMVIPPPRAHHSHDHRPPASEVDFQNEVSGYGFPGFAGDPNDNFIIEIEYGDKHDRESFKRLKTLRAKFRLRHQLLGVFCFRIKSSCLRGL